MSISYEKFFRVATGGKLPYDFQRRFAQANGLSILANVPTGLGKTAMVVLGWTWRRFLAPKGMREATPRRLVYCLPMRVLVEQTRDNAVRWMDTLQVSNTLADKVPVHVLMGGEAAEEWDADPEREMILIGTQDMLLSRALNRGYGMSRSRWPLALGFLNTDSLWVFDETQLMGAGLATTAQLDSFRHSLGSGDGHGCCSVWMSATLQPDWLRTVDFKQRVGGLSTIKLSQADHENAEVNKRWTAKKPLGMAKARMDDPHVLASEVCKAHKPGTRTIVVVNTVRRACDLFSSIEKQFNAESRNKGAKRKHGLEVTSPSRPNPVLLHSRFRPLDRDRRIQEILSEPSGAGIICISTQVIEAGVDVSSSTMFTELAPWASLVQRFGRCNRNGDESARIYWIDLPREESAKPKLAVPYELDDLRDARKRLKGTTDVGLCSLPDVNLPFVHGHVIRRKDLIDLFDTTPDLAGNDIDIDRFIRDVEETDVRVFWRDYDQTPNKTDDKEAEPQPHRNEICPAPVGEFRAYAKVKTSQQRIWRWGFLEGRWENADASRIAPGQVFLIHADAGGYSSARGWTGDPADKPVIDCVPENDERTLHDCSEDDIPSRMSIWKTIAQHSDDVCNELQAIHSVLALSEIDALRLAARWHDWGKAHPVFQAALPSRESPNGSFWAKAAGVWRRYKRRHFRHELAAALAVLDPKNVAIPGEYRDLTAYLIAAHHGKVRLSIRSLPNENRPQCDGDTSLDKRGRRFARGVWDGDELPETDLGGGIIAPSTRLSLEPMELGLCEHEPFVGQPSWSERMIRLRDALGPFRLAYLEAILRVADMRASRPAVVVTGPVGAPNE